MRLNNSNNRMPNAIARKVALDELNRRRAQDAQQLFDKTPKVLTKAEWDFWLKRCHPKQRAFLIDPSKKIALLCPRRTGKTTTMLFKALIAGQQHPGSDIAYIVPNSKQHAKRLFWKPLQKMNAQLGLGLEFMVAEAMVKMPNGTHIYVFGAKDKNSPAQLRGNAWSLALMDEAKDFGPHFEELMIESVQPGLEDYDGTLVLGGTPGSVLAGMFFEVTTQDREGFSVHKWVKSDNPFLPDAARNLEIVERNEYFPYGLDRHSPKFRREQLAEWCTDDTERVYFYDPYRNGWAGSNKSDLPSGHDWYYCLGLDLGERDANAFVVGAFSLTEMNLYVVHQHAQPRMSIDEIAEYTRELITRFGAFAAMVADTGGYGRGIVTDLENRHQLVFDAADKRGNKLGNIAQMNSDMLQGRIKCNPKSSLALEWNKLTRKIRPSDLKVLLSHSDLGDAALYMWKASRHYAATAPKPKTKPLTKQWWAEQEDRLFDDALKEKQRRYSEGFFPALSDANQALHSAYA